MPDNDPLDKRTIIARANAVGLSLTNDFGPVRALVEAHEIIFGVFPSVAYADGVGTMIVKGRQTLAEIATGVKPRPVSWTAIPCLSVEQAVALKRVCGDAEFN